MAGVVPKKSASGRKQWTLYDHSKTSLSRLRNQLASDGCSESQVVLAKQLLEEKCEHETERMDNAKLGIYWLIKASEQGNLEATELLKNALKTGKGITELNYIDVKTCINMSQEEKLARKAARELFANLSNGGEYITSEQLQKRILAVDRNQTSIKLMDTDDDEELTSDSDEDWPNRSDLNEKLTEDNLISAATDYSHGHLPLVNHMLQLTEPHLNALDCIPYVQRSVLHPWLALTIIYHKFIQFASNNCYKSIHNNTLLYLLLTLYILANCDDFIHLFLILSYYLSYIIMMLSTFKMLQKKREFIDYRMWSGLFLCYSGGHLNASDIEDLYVKNNLKYYANYFLALLLNLIIYPSIADKWLIQSELTIISFGLTLMTFYGFMSKRHTKIRPDYTVILSFIVNVLAKYPYETDQLIGETWGMIVMKMPILLNDYLGDSDDFCMNLRLFLYLSIPLFFVRMAMRDRWRGVYEMLIPHCVTLSWLQICIINAQGATMYGLLRGVLATIGLIVLVPLAGITSVILTSAALTYSFIDHITVLGVCMFIAFTIILYFICRIFAKSSYNRTVAHLQIVSAIIASLILTNSLLGNRVDYGENVDDMHLSWDIYQRFCHQPVWQEENVALAQMKCSQLEGSAVHWDGYVVDIKIKSIQNNWKVFLDKFPHFFRDYLYCAYGDENVDDCGVFPLAVQDECRRFYNAISTRCSLERYNSYVFELNVRMDSMLWGKSPIVNVVLDDYFKNFTLKLKPNDHIWLKGDLYNDESVGADGVLGGFKPHVKLDEMGCLACANNQLIEIKIEHDKLLYNLVDSVCLGVKFILNVIFYPIFNLK